MNKHLTVCIVIIILATVGTITVATLTAQQSFGTLEFGDGSVRGRDGAISMPTLQRVFGGGVDDRKAPIATSGDNTYISWWTNKTGNDEVMFRASTDNAATFADKINLSNTTGAESEDVEIAAEGDNVIVTWWERNQTAEEPVARISTDNGQSFGPLLKLATNGTIGGSSDTE